MSKNVDVTQTLNKIKNLVCIEKKYSITKHIITYMEKGKCSFEDIEHCIQKAKTIHGMGVDVFGDSPDGILYTIRGKTKIGQEFYTTGKFIKSNDGEEIYFFITAHQTDKNHK